MGKNSAIFLYIQKSYVTWKSVETKCAGGLMPSEMNYSSFGWVSPIGICLLCNQVFVNFLKLYLLEIWELKSFIQTPHNELFLQVLFFNSEM